MQKIVYGRTDGGLSVIHPAEGARLVSAAKVSGEAVAFDPPVAADTIHRAWPHPDVTDVVWAETEADFVARIAAKDVPITLIAPPEGLPMQISRVEALRLGLAFLETIYVLVDESDLPADRTFRGAWTIAGGVVAVDMPIAREIHRKRLRALRAPKLAALDVQWMRAVEAGDVAAQQLIVSEKQALRDVTEDPAIEAAATPEALAAVMPGVLL